MKLILFSPPENHPSELELVKRCFEAGLTHFHLRKPKATKQELSDYLSKIPAKYHNRIVLHGHYSLVEKYLLRGIHLPEYIRKSGAFDAKAIIVSTSYHSIADLEANKFSYKYVFLSPIFDSISKPDYPAAFEKSALQELLKRTSQRIIALGGIQAANIQAVKTMGFHGAALLGAVWNSPDPIAAFNRTVGFSRQ